MMIDSKKKPAIKYLVLIIKNMTVNCIFFVLLNTQYFFQYFSDHVFCSTFLFRELYVVNNSLVWVGSIQWIGLI